MIRDKVSTLLLFGATGDLSHRMLLPSLYGLHADGLLPEKFRIVCTARSELDDEQFRASAVAALKEHVAAGFYDPRTALVFSRRLTYVPLDANFCGQSAGVSLHHVLGQDRDICCHSAIETISKNRGVLDRVERYDMLKL